MCPYSYNENFVKAFWNSLAFRSSIFLFEQKVKFWGRCKRVEREKLISIQGVQHESFAPYHFWFAFFTILGMALQLPILNPGLGPIK